ncbi:Aromatic-ring-opening dioxygenase LigAB, LigA subunit [Pyrobaculum oguniense TE7]|mgnify:CR=1 FL=1|uniref:Aromatic-ring-opening dioxygenase LigAB, LigA subunit n=1 Tax=Pyrobaculum oguniense (strain DSM 13380 / JCM 10595 / TE7) TaxID=698757 RepID=H6Q9F7_PYROT|nr:Aromatic-ring-opening dioxygenase LigAB, LigA subunit [Pyrobaculum oguniense TE7]
METVSRNEIFKIERLLRDFHLRPEIRERFKKEPDAVMAEYGIDKRFWPLLKEGRLYTLYKMGVHQLLLYHLAHVLGIKRDEYVKRINDPSF